jgi:hypothetical protein
LHVSDLHELVPVPADVDGRQVHKVDLTSSAIEHEIVVVLGPSGMGKTHTARHAAIELTDRRHLVVWLRCAEYGAGRFGSLLARAVARFSTEPALELMRKAVDTGNAITVVLDGVNECPSSLRPELFEQVHALRLRIPIGMVITSTVPLALPAPLSATTVTLRPPDAAERQAILSSYGVADPEVVGESFVNPYELAIAAECWSELDPDATQSDLLDAYVRRRAGTASVRAALRRLAAAMDADVRASLTAADAMAALQQGPHPVPPAVIDEALMCPLLLVGQGRVSFAHELLGRFLAAEDLVLRSLTGTALGESLTEPQHADLQVYALLLERDSGRRHEALLALADPGQLTRAALGEFGEVTAHQVRADVCSLLLSAAAATVDAEPQAITQSGRAAMGVEYAPGGTAP